jgi:hypothetical protein
MKRASLLLFRDKYRLAYYKKRVLVQNKLILFITEDHFIQYGNITIIYNWQS